MAEPSDEIVTVLQAIPNHATTKAPIARVVKLLEAGTHGAELANAFDALLDVLAAKKSEAIDGLMKPVIALAKAQKGSSGLHETAARILILREHFDDALAMLGDRWTVHAQDLWCDAMAARIKKVSQVGKARTILDEMWKHHEPKNVYFGRKLLSATLAWIGRASKGADATQHAAIIERATRALALEIDDPDARRYRLDLYGRLAFALRKTERFAEALDAVRAVIPLRAHIKTPNDHANYTWAMAEGAYIAVEKLPRTAEARAFVGALREALGHAPEGDPEKSELAYGIGLEARAALIDGDIAEATKLVGELEGIAPEGDASATSTAILLRGDLAFATGDRDAANRNWSEVVQRYGESTDEVVRETVNRARTNLAKL